jgi:hypothetical protein
MRSGASSGSLPGPPVVHPWCRRSASLLARRSLPARVSARSAAGPHRALRAPGLRAQNPRPFGLRFPREGKSKAARRAIRGPAALRSKARRGALVARRVLNHPLSPSAWFRSAAHAARRGKAASDVVPKARARRRASSAGLERASLDALARENQERSKGLPRSACQLATRERRARRAVKGAAARVYTNPSGSSGTPRTTTPCARRQLEHIMLG